MKITQRRLSVKKENSAPTANLTISKNRVKIYDNNTYYLQVGQTFEIELFNPTTDKIKADIHLDGNIVSGGGIVIKPGERVYLERFVESDNKFVFETYEVEDTEEVNDAIAGNGELKVFFYKEKVQLWANDYNIINTGPSFPPRSNNSPWYTTHNCYYSNTSGNTDFIGSDVLRSTENTLSFTSDSNTQETGRTEKGEASGQMFKADYSDYYDLAFANVEYKILPISKQPLTKKELNVKRYCHECGSKTKSNFKFCPSCGEKL